MDHDARIVELQSQRREILERAEAHDNEAQQLRFQAVRIEGMIQNEQYHKQQHEEQG